MVAASSIDLFVRLTSCTEASPGWRYAFGIFSVFCGTFFVSRAHASKQASKQAPRQTGKQARKQARTHAREQARKEASTHARRPAGRQASERARTHAGRQAGNTETSPSLPKTQIPKVTGRAVKHRSSLATSRISWDW